MKMKKKATHTISTLCICLCITLLYSFCSNAEFAGESIDFSYLNTEDALIGYANLQTKGVYLANGYSIINRQGTGKIGWGGITNAAIRCKVSVSSMVERKTSTGWAFVTSYTQTNQDAFTAMISRSLYVSTGSQYRVRSYHYANSDGSTSFTDALVM